jgi:hypothetical protein
VSSLAFVTADAECTAHCNQGSKNRSRKIQPFRVCFEYGSAVGSVPFRHSHTAEVNNFHLHFSSGPQELPMHPGS